MPIIRCDFDVRGDFVLPAELEELCIADGPPCRISLRNGEKDDQGNVISLIGVAIGESLDHGIAKDEFKGHIARSLDKMTFVSHARFSVRDIKRSIDWNEYQESRRLVQYTWLKSTRYPPEPILGEDFNNAIKRIDEIDPPGYIRTGMNLFRTALFSDQPVDQFFRFWLALEIISNNIQQKERVAIECVKCKGDLVCDKCKSPATRFPMSKQTISDIIEEIAADGGEKFKLLYEIRNTLMHGGDYSKKLDKKGMKMSEVIDMLGDITWRALYRQLGNGKEAILVGHFDGEFSRRGMGGGANIIFRCSAEKPHPAENEIPAVELSILSSFRERKAGV